MDSESPDPLYDPADPETIADPFPAFAALRAHEPVHRSERLGGWVLTRFPDVKAALNDRRLHADRITPFVRHMERVGRPVDFLASIVGNWAVFTDPPRHTRLRGLMNRAFTPSAVARLGPRIERVVDALADDMERIDNPDLVRDFAYPLPVTVIAHMIGLPVEDHRLFKTWSDELATFVGSGLAMSDKYDRAERAAREMADYFRAAVEARRRAPRDDILSALIAAEDRGDVLGEDELVASCILLLFAGHETTTNLIGNGVYWMVRHRSPWNALAASADLAEPAVEEALRYDGPTPAMVRVAASDFAIDGTEIVEGARVFAMLSAANRDPEIFDDPDRFDIRRSPNRHIAFGYGIHFCLGAPLARLEGRIAFARLAQRFPALRLADEEPEWLPSLIFRGVRALPLRLEGA